MREQLSVESYVDELLSLVAADDRCETVPVAESLGRVLAREGADVVILEAPARRGAHVRKAGEDVGRGAVVAHAGAIITPGVAGAVAAVRWL